MKLNLTEISEIINAKLDGDPLKIIEGVNELDKANENEIAFALNDRYQKSLINTNAGVVIINKNLKKFCKSNTLLVDDVYLAFSIITHKFKSNQDISDLKYAHELTLSNSKISPNCLIGRNVEIGINSAIGPNCIIEDNVRIGSNSSIEANVTIQRECVIGNDCIISPGVVIGSEGFGNARDNFKKWNSVAHLGKVIIGNNVSIGANTTIDRGTISNTEIHTGVKIDNLIHIAHNVIVGEDTAIAAKTGIAGTTVIGKRCMIGGAVGIVGHLKITDDVVINATSTVNRDITKPGVYTGFVPLMLHSEWKKVGMWLTKLDKIATFMKIKLKNIR
jgi:UDP-3-O-[3-hydroxymyristoyl] glucosamine N-acyltransferase